MNRYLEALILSLALTPVSAQAQLQGGGTQQLLSELKIDQDKEAQNQVEMAPQASEATDMPDIVEFQVGSIIVTGIDGIAVSEFGPVIEPFIGRVIGNAGLQEIATAIAADARRRGFVLATAYVPQQSVTLGNLKIVVDLGFVDRVEIQGSDNARLRAVLSGLEGRYAQRTELERALLLGRDIPGILINGTDYVREGGSGKLVIRAAEQKSSGWVGLDNYGDSSGGPVRARLDVDYAGIFDDGDRLSVGVTATPLQPKELTFVSARYTRLIGNDGAQLWLTGAAGRTQDMQPGDDWHSRSRYIALAYNAPIIRSNAANLWLTAEAAVSDIDQASGSISLEDRVTTLSLSATGNVRLAGGRLSGGITHVRGIDVLGATKANDPDSSRSNGSGVFSKEQVWLNWFGPLGGGFSMRIAGNGQIAARPLLASQELGLGGIGYGRAYSFYERSGDEGAMGLLELRHATDRPVKFVDWLQLYGFVDGGYVSNLGDDFGSGSLVSSGAGLRTGLGKAEIGLELVIPLDDVRVDTNDRSPRINFSVGYRF